MGVNVKEAIKILKRCGYKPEKVKDGWLVHHGYHPSDGEIMTNRELIKHAKIWTSENHQTTKMKGNMKYFRHRNNRAKTKEDISKENWDNFDKNQLRRDENSWNWD